MKRELEMLLEVDRQFAAEAQTQKVEAWEKYVAQDAIMGTPGTEDYIIGYSAMEPALVSLYQLDNLTFTWTPQYAFVSHDKTLGVTTGYYQRTFLQDGHEVTQHGKYMNVWKPVNGMWKIVFDMGN